MTNPTATVRQIRITLIGWVCLIVILFFSRDVHFLTSVLTN